MCFLTHAATPGCPDLTASESPCPVLSLASFGHPLSFQPVEFPIDQPFKNVGPATKVVFGQKRDLFLGGVAEPV